MRLTRPVYVKVIPPEVSIEHNIAELSSSQPDTTYLSVCQWRRNKLNVSAEVLKILQFDSVTDAAAVLIEERQQ
eukprot:2700123-Rhodomonas_salina.2